MGRYGKGMRDCCDSPAQPSARHIFGCPYRQAHERKLALEEREALTPAPRA